jgi:hypothetical protein
MGCGLCEERAHTNDTMRFLMAPRLLRSPYRLVGLRTYMHGGSPVHAPTSAFDLGSLHATMAPSKIPIQRGKGLHSAADTCETAASVQTASAFGDMAFFFLKRNTWRSDPINPWRWRVVYVRRPTHAAASSPRDAAQSETLLTTHR